MTAVNVSVYRFSRWDRERGESIVAPRMGTLSAISAINGKPDLNSMLLVAEVDLDADGFYSSKGVQDKGR